jgi:hypothetical protein
VAQYSRETHLGSRGDAEEGSFSYWTGPILQFSGVM